MRYGKLIVLCLFGVDKWGKNSTWLCRCDCGIEKVINKSSLRKGTTSCGCASIEKFKERFTTHGKTNSRTYECWQNIKSRCSNPKNIGHKNYMDRGIKVCDRWIESFQNFLEDMGEMKQGMSIERIDVNGNYCPENCTWIKKELQGKNKRTVTYIKYKNELLTAMDAWKKSKSTYCYATFLKYAKQGILCV